MAATTITRHLCPACATPTGTEVLASLELGSPTFRTYFHTFYPPSVAALIERLALPAAELRACPQCGTVFHGVVPAPEILAAFYSALQAATIATARPVETHREEQRLLELMMVVRFLQPAAPRPSVLDFGTGDGSWARLAGATGCGVSVTDTAETAFPSLTAAGVACLAPDRLPPSSFDFINVEQVFEHLPDPATILSTLAASLRPNGILKIGVPHDPNLRAKLAAPDWSAPKNSPSSLNSLAPIEHLNAFTPAGLDLLGVRFNLVPLGISGWTLLDPRQPHRLGIRSRLVRLLRNRLGQRHRPPFTLSQTRFFLRPA